MFEGNLVLADLALELELQGGWVVLMLGVFCCPFDQAGFVDVLRCAFAEAGTE